MSMPPCTPTTDAGPGVGRPGPTPGLRGHPGLPARAAAQPVRGRGGPPAGRSPGRGHDRPLRRLGRGPALHPAQPLPPGRGHAAAGAPPSAGRDDLLGLGRPPQSDRRFVDPHPPLGLLGPRPPGVHPGRSGPHDHPGPGPGLGIRTTGDCCGPGWPPTSMSSIPSRWARPSPRWSTTSRRRTPARATVARASGHPGERPGDHPRRASPTGATPGRLLRSGGLTGVRQRIQTCGSSRRPDDPTALVEHRLGRGSGCPGSGRPCRRRVAELVHDRIGVERGAVAPSAEPMRGSPIKCMLDGNDPGRPHGLEPLVEGLGTRGSR